jgi:hypothetical protein
MRGQHYQGTAALPKSGPPRVGVTGGITTPAAPGAGIQGSNVMKSSPSV